MLRIFDQPIVARNCTVRQPAPVVNQSLTLLHDDFVLEQARNFADRVAGISKDFASDEQIAAAFRLAFGRRPQHEELGETRAFLQRHAARYEGQGISKPVARKKALTHLCHMLLNASEFLYVQ